jgi:hypothetical protein
MKKIFLEVKKQAPDPTFSGLEPSAWGGEFCGFG